jgi:hypothetical protein
MSRLVHPDQIHLYMVWLKLDRPQGLPLRSSLRPGRFAACLKDVTLLQAEGEAWRVRLAGSALVPMLGHGARGQTVAALGTAQAGTCVDHGFIDTLSPPVDGQPRAGLRCVSNGRLHAFLRLPLSSDGVRTDMLLAHDLWLSAAEIEAPTPAEGRPAPGAEPFRAVRTHPEALTRAA